MDKLKNLITSYLGDFPEFDYYIPIIDKAENNKLLHPDISIECCNALIQGICKTIILRLDDTAKEDDFTTRAASLALAISTLRNARGDISHGKAVPKKLQSNMELARAVITITSALLVYTLSSFFALEFEKYSPVETSTPAITYSTHPDFNDYLDELYPHDGKVLYSEALYDKYYEDYIIQLDDFLDEQTLE